MNALRHKTRLTLLLFALALLLAACDIPEWVLPQEIPSPTPDLGGPKDTNVTPTPIDELSADTAIEASRTPRSPADLEILGSGDQDLSAASGKCTDVITGNSLTYREARVIATESECTTSGDLLPVQFCNAETGTWWLSLYLEKEGCNPACVVDVNDRSAVINWRCAGAVESTSTPLPQTAGADQTAGNPQGFTDWQGILHRQPSGSQIEYRFLRDDGQWFDIGSKDPAQHRLFTNIAWSGVKVSIAGDILEADGFVNISSILPLDTHASEARDLTPFAMPSASSHLATDEGGPYIAWSAVDGVQTLPWCEGAEGPGIGEWIQLDFSSPLEVTAIELSNGFNDDDYLWEANRKVRRAKILLDNEETTTWDLLDTRGMQSLSLAGDVVPGETATSLKIVIEDTYEGWTYDDTCISEIAVWGRPQQ